MKLRLHKNAVRLRLSQPEVEEISKGNSVHETMEFGNDTASHFKYSLVPVEDTSHIHIEYTPNNLRITFPKSRAEEWAKTDLVSLRNEANQNISLLIEKDFQCLHKRPDEDESNNFPNPLGSQ